MVRVATSEACKYAVDNMMEKIDKNVRFHPTPKALPSDGGQILLSFGKQSMWDFPLIKIKNHRCLKEQCFRIKNEPDLPLLGYEFDGVYMCKLL